MLLDEVVIQEDFAVAHIDLRYVLGVDAAQFLEDPRHGFLFVLHAEGVRDGTHCEVVVKGLSRLMLLLLLL